MDNTMIKIKENMEKVIIGKSQVIDLVLTAFVAGGHVLLEDVPGTGKTVLAKTLAKSMDCEFKRIQFTPDLLPSDITGVNIFRQNTGEFEFQKGPIFANIILADEINRATPRTQAGLLESMEEGQVSIEGTTYALEQPFFVIATENPLETLGTFPLPEAQLDRFLMKLSVGLPNKEEEIQMMERFMKNSPLEILESVVTKEEIMAVRNKVKDIYVHPLLLGYMADLVKRTREDSQVENGVSPRGTLCLLNAASAYALIQGREYVVPVDIKAVAVGVLAHRIQKRSMTESGQKAINFIKSILEQVLLPTESWNTRI